MLTFEIDIKGQKLEIHSDLSGLIQLKEIIENLISQAEKEGNEHVHLMTEYLGGPGPSSLTDDKQCDENEIINHVKLFCWNDKRKS